MRDDRRPRLPLLDAARSHLRVAAPVPLWLPFLVCFAVARGYFAYVRMRFGVFGADFSPIGAPMICFNAALLGAFRAVVFHPQRDSSYREWLARTPWTAARPLPRGPIQLVWPDGLVVGALLLVGALAPELDSIRIIGIYLFSYCMVAAFLTLATMAFAPAYLALFCLGFMARFWSDPWVSGAFGVASYLVVYWGIRRSLMFFPWSPPAEVVALSEGVIQALGGAKTSKLGWPYERLLVQPTRGPDKRKLVGHSIVACSLIGWWLSCLLADASDMELKVLMNLAGFLVACGGMSFRVGVYFTGYNAPISLAGRIAARRLIAPGYDQAFLVFPLMFLAPGTVRRIGEALGLSPAIYEPIIPPLVLFIALTTPPGLRQWRLTGRHRMVAAIRAQDKNFVRVG